MNKTYKVKDILNEMKKFENSEIIIKSKNNEFDIKLFKNFTPHLLGIHYINIDNEYKGGRLFQFINKQNLSDQDILNMIEKNYGEKQKINVENRINTFLDFMRNLEKSIVVEKTLKTNMKINYLLIQDENTKEIKHLGICSTDNGALLVSYNDLIKQDKDFFRTYFVRDDKDYYNNTKIFEKIKSIQVYKEESNEYLPFSFDENKNKYLIDQWNKNKDGFDYIKTIKNYYLDKENLNPLEEKDEGNFYDPLEKDLDSLSIPLDLQKIKAALLELERIYGEPFTARIIDQEIYVYRLSGTVLEENMNLHDLSKNPEGVYRGAKGIAHLMQSQDYDDIPNLAYLNLQARLLDHQHNQLIQDQNEHLARFSYNKSEQEQDAMLIKQILDTDMDGIPDARDDHPIRNQQREWESER